MSSSPENVLITRSPYVTLIYFLVNELQKIKNTAYFFVITRACSEEEIRHTREIFPHSYFFREYSLKSMFKKYSILRRFCTALQICSRITVPYLVLRATKNFRWPFLKTAELFCWDLPPIAKALIGKCDYTFLEEGLGVYAYAELEDTLHSKDIPYSVRLARFLYAPFGLKPLGLSPQAKRIILTRLAEIPNCYKDKNVEIISIPELWEKSSPEKKALIMKFFDLTFEDIEAIKQKDIIFVEQPLDGYLTVEEKIEMLRRILNRYAHSRILLKTHYRTTINYKELFPDVLVWDKHTPMELLNLCGAKFTEAITINSTAALCFPEDVHIVWLGSNPEDPCFAHFSPESRDKFNKFVNELPIPSRIKAQNIKKEGLFKC